MKTVTLNADVLIVVERPTSEGGVWGAEVPHLAGCFARGDSLDDVITMVDQEIAKHTEAKPISFETMLQLADLSILNSDEFDGRISIVRDVELTIIKPDIIKDTEYPDLSDGDKLLQKITYKIPRVAVGAIIINPRGEVLMCRRPHGPENYVGKLHTFGGKVDLGESLFDAISREVLEECNIDVTTAWKTDMVGMIEEIEPDCIYEVDGVNQMYHWVSSIWVFWLNDDVFMNVEPHKHHDMGWVDFKDVNRLDIAPSAYHSLVLAGLLEPMGEWTSTIDRSGTI